MLLQTVTGHTSVTNSLTKPHGWLQKAKEAFGSQKKPGDETQEPAGVMENR